MRTIPRLSGLPCVVAILALAVTVSGCGVSLIGKRRQQVQPDVVTWRLGLVTLRSFEDNGGRNLVALYDDEIPEGEGFTLLQLWGGRSTKKP